MLVQKCDLCKKELDRTADKIVWAGHEYVSQFSFCETCGQPVIRFLKRVGLILKEKGIKK